MIYAILHTIIHHTIVYYTVYCIMIYHATLLYLCKRRLGGATSTGVDLHPCTRFTKSSGYIKHTSKRIPEFTKRRKRNRRQKNLETCVICSLKKNIQKSTVQYTNLLPTWISTPAMANIQSITAILNFQKHAKIIISESQL